VQCSGRWAGRWYTPSDFTVRIVAQVFTRGQPVQLSSPPAPPPSDDISAPPPLPVADSSDERAARNARFMAGLRQWESALALLLISTVYSLIQGSTQNIIGIDGYYHIKVAQLMREQGWRLLAPLDFPWLQMTILGPGRYTDHHFLFHVLQAPFTAGDLRVAAKMAAVLFAVIGLYTTYQFLARFQVRYAHLWIAVLLASSPIFLWRQSMARTQSLSLLLIVLGLWALFARRPLLLVPVGFLAAWLFNGFFFVLGAPLAAVLVSLGGMVLRRWWLRAPADERTEDAARADALAVAAVAAGEADEADEADEATAPAPVAARPAAQAEPTEPPLRFALVALGCTLLGLGLGLLLHPYFPRNVEFAFFHLLPKAVPAEQASVTVGQEWYPYSVSGYITRVGPTLTLTLLGLVPPALMMLRRQWPDWRTLVLGILALGFLAMVTASQRIIEYFPAFGMIFCAWSWSHAPGTRATLAGLLRLRPSERRDRVTGRLTVAAPWVVALLVAPFITTSILVASRQAGEGVSWSTYRDGALWLAANTPAGSRVFTTGWDDFPHMFFWNTHNVYLAGLDPTYSSLEDPATWEVWRSITQGRTRAPSGQIRQRFGASYVLTDLQHERFLQMAASDPGLEEVFRTKTVVIYRVRGG